MRLVIHLMKQSSDRNERGKNLLPDTCSLNPDCCFLIAVFCFSIGLLQTINLYFGIGKTPVEAIGHFIIF